MDDEDNDYELERQKTIAENRALLDSLGLDPAGIKIAPSSSSALPSAIKSKPKPKAKRKSEPRSAAEDAAASGPRRRSGRIAGFEADGEVMKVKLEEEEKEREVLRVISRKERGKVMRVKEMIEEPEPGEPEAMEHYLKSTSSLPNPRALPTPEREDTFADLESDTKKQSTEVTRLKDAFKNMTLRANAKVTNDRVFSMIVHPEKTKNLVLVGDKYGQLGIWDALGPSAEKVKDEDDTAGVEAQDQNGEEFDQGRYWRVQAHARNSITAMKVDPVDGSGLFSSSYDCSLRHFSFSSLKSTELFAFSNDDMLITHFDIVPTGQEAWIADKNGGVSHCDFREGKRNRERRRWVVQEEGRAAKLGGLSVNPLMPHLIVTAGNDQHLRIWDTRHFSNINPRSAHILTPPPSAKKGDGKFDPDSEAEANTRPTSNVENDAVVAYMSSNKGKGLLRASWQHGKSCSAAYWDPWGRRILTTSYDDKLRVWSLDPDSLSKDAPLAGGFTPKRQIPHNCQTGRWLTILRAQWSGNMEYMPHFTVGNMKRSLDVIAGTGEKIVSLWAEGVTAVPAVSASHPGRVDCVVGGNTSGRIQLWTSGTD